MLRIKNERQAKLGLRPLPVLNHQDLNITTPHRHAKTDMIVADEGLEHMVDEAHTEKIKRRKENLKDVKD